MEARNANSQRHLVSDGCRCDLRQRLRQRLKKRQEHRHNKYYWNGRTHDTLFIHQNRAAVNSNGVNDVRPESRDSSRSGHDIGHRSNLLENQPVTIKSLYREGQHWGILRFSRFANESDDGKFAHVKFEILKEMTVDDVSGSSFPLVIRWAMSGRNGGSWKSCSFGWATEPPKSWDSGDHISWETETTVEKPGVYEATFKLPISNQGPKFFACVIRTADYQWLQTDTAKNLYVPFTDLERTELLPPTHNMPRDDANTHDNIDKSDDEIDVESELPILPKRPIHSFEWTSFARDTGRLLCHGDGACDGIIREIKDAEADSERSLMHRYRNASTFIDKHGDSTNALIAILVWLRLASIRELVWNKNYNVKPREISVEQEVCARRVAKLFEIRPDSELLRLLLASIGRGGSADAGQRYYPLYNSI